MVDAGPAFARDGCQALTERWYSRRMRQVEIKYRRRYTRGHYNYHHNAVIKYRGRSYELEHGSGSDDYDYAYMQGPRAYVLTINRRLPYVGLAEFDLTREAEQTDDSEAGQAIWVWKPVAEAFFQEGQVEEVLGPRGVDYSERTILRRLLPYLG